MGERKHINKIPPKLRDVCVFYASFVFSRSHKILTFKKNTLLDYESECKINNISGRWHLFVDVACYRGVVHAHEP